MPTTTASPAAPISRSGSVSQSRRAAYATLIVPAPVRRIAATRSVEPGGHAGEVVERHHDPRRVLRDDVVEARRAIRRPRTRRRPRARAAGCARRSSSRPVEPAALPGRAAGHHGRHPPAVQRAVHVEVADAVETQLDHVAGGRGVAGRQQFAHRGARHGFAQSVRRIGHRLFQPRPEKAKRPFNREAEGALNPSYFLRVRQARLRRWQPPPQQSGTTTNSWRWSTGTKGRNEAVISVGNR